LQYQGLPINERCSLSGYEYENFCCIKELNCLDRKVAEDVFRDVVDEYKDQGKTPKKIETKIARRSGQVGSEILVLVAAHWAM